MAALAGIGAMPDTIEDRAVVIRMRRRAPGESVAPFRHRRDRPALTALAADLARWLGAHLPELEKAEPVMPLEDRAADTWEPLIAVADLAAGEWPALARHAAVVLTADRDQAADMSDRIRLLADCRTAFGDADALPSTTLVARLRSDPEAPWGEPAPGHHPQAARGPAGRLRHPVGQPPVPGADRASEGLLPGRFHRRMGAVLPAPGGGSVPAVPSVPAQLRPGTDQNLGRIDPSHQNTRPRADLRRDGWDGWDGYPPLRRHQRRRWCRVTLAIYTLDEAAAILRVKPSWLERQAAARKIPFTMLGGSYRFTADHLAAIVAQHEEPARPPNAFGAELPPRQAAEAARRKTCPPACFGPGPWLADARPPDDNEGETTMAYAEKRGNLWRARWRAPDGKLDSKPGFRTRKAAEDYGSDQEAAIRNHTYVDPRAGLITLTEWVNSGIRPLTLSQRP